MPFLFTQGFALYHLDDYAGRATLLLLQLLHDTLFAPVKMVLVDIAQHANCSRHTSLSILDDCCEVHHDAVPLGNVVLYFFAYCCYCWAYADAAVAYHDLWQCYLGAAHSFQQALNLNPGDRVLRQVSHSLLALSCTALLVQHY